jgi:hypothetical protein
MGIEDILNGHTKDLGGGFTCAGCCLRRAPLGGALHLL